MTNLSQDIAAYEVMRADLEAAHNGEWAVVHDRELICVFPTFDEAATTAIQKFGRGPYLIRQIGAAALNLPASVMFRQLDETGQLRV